MIGQSSPLSPTVAFADQFKALDRRIADLERREATRLVVQHGVENVALDGSGRGTITFPIEFPGAPTIPAPGVVFSTATTMTVHVVSKSSTEFVVQVDSDGTAVASQTRQINWVAYYG